MAKRIMGIYLYIKFYCMKTLKNEKTAKKEVINSILLKKTVGGNAVCAAACVYELNQNQGNLTESKP